MNNILLESFEKQVSCNYKNESYLVRDNGAILRRKRPGKRKRPLDEKWTFGSPCKSRGYMMLSGVAIHRIVATAFLGEPPTNQHVVDHIDTNRRNNRIENLRWVTKMENILLNPITRKKIILAYGSIEAFFENPHKPDIPNLLGQFDWMRTVSKEEALASKKRLESWAESDKSPNDGRFGDWLFKTEHQKKYKSTQVESLVNAKFNSQFRKPSIAPTDMTKDTDIKSLTPHSIQRNWKTPCEFPLCPGDSVNHSLEDYKNNLSEGAVFSKNEYRDTSVLSAELKKGKSEIIALCEFNQDAVKPWAICSITLENGNFCHNNLGSCFSREGAEKQYCLALGLPWNGPDSVDGYC